MPLAASFVAFNLCLHFFYRGHGQQVLFSTHVVFALVVVMAVVYRASRLPRKQILLAALVALIVANNALALRQVYGSLLLNGPFAVIIAHQGEMIGLTDRIRLRPLTVGEKGDMLYLSSEESAIRLISPDLDKAWIPTGGQPVIGRLKDKATPKPEAVEESLTAGDAK